MIQEALDNQDKPAEGDPVILDGYGDHAELDEVEVQCNEVITSVWADRMVAAVVWDQTIREDLAQEARLAMWQAAPRWDKRGSLEGYLHQAARWRVKSILDGSHRYTGQERTAAVSQRRGDEARQRMREAISTFRTEHDRDPSATELATELGIHPATARKQRRGMTTMPLDVSTQVSSLDALIDAYGVQAVLGVNEAFDAVLLAYHYGEIHRAVAELDPLWREYVYLRFWCGYGDSECARTLGSRVHWSSGVRPRLAEKLEHLANTI